MKRSVLIVAIASACSGVQVNVGTGPEEVDAGAGYDPAYTANCGVPDGPVHPYTTAEEATQLLTATTWVFCSGFSLDGSTQAGIVFDSDMIFHDVEGWGSDNTLVELAGTSANTWAMQQLSSGQIELLVTTEFTGNQLDEVWSLRFEDSPRKLLVAGASKLESLYAIAP